MKTIWKFTLGNGSPQRVSMPKGAEILAVQQQDGAAQLWALVDPSYGMETRYIEVYGTGQAIHEDMGVERRYVGTFQQPPFVWHVFERL